jgi:acyl carrier protein
VYPFQRKRYWIATPAAQPPDGVPASPGHVATHERASLVASRYPRPTLSARFEEPTSPVERSLARIWEDLLGTAPIGVNDSFFELGGNSLLATQLAVRLGETFPVEVPLRALFEAATIRDLARLLESLLVAKVDSLSEAEAAQLLAGIAQGELGQ